MKITDEMLTHAAPHACTLWLETTSAEIPRQAASLRFERKIARLLRHPHRPIGWRGPVAAVAAAALLTMTVGAEVLPPVRAFRSGVVHVLSQVLPKSTDQIYTTDADHEGETKRPVLGWLPENMVEIKRVELTNITRINFENPDGDRLSIHTKRITEGETPSFTFDTEDAETEEIILHGNPASLITEDNSVLIIFFIANYRCSISGTLSVEDTVRIAENIILQ